MWGGSQSLEQFKPQRQGLKQMICNDPFGSMFSASVILWKLIWKTQENSLKYTWSKSRDTLCPKIFFSCKFLFRWGVHVLSIVYLIFHIRNTALWKTINYCRRNRKSQRWVMDPAQRKKKFYKEPEAKSQFDSHYALAIRQLCSSV